MSGPSGATHARVGLVSGAIPHTVMSEVIVITMGYSASRCHGERRPQCQRTDQLHPSAPTIPAGVAQ
jgi:hypothetical protein